MTGTYCLLLAFCFSLIVQVAGITYVNDVGLDAGNARGEEESASASSNAESSTTETAVSC